jgi:methionyl-tRNA synthetase
MQPIFIGGAWPYANGSLHIGQIAALLPGDVLARYFRQTGHPVLYVSGTDCHGTPIAVRAAREKTDPAELAVRYHTAFSDVFRRLGFSYDHYGRTDDPRHIRLVQDFFGRLLVNGLLEERPVRQAACPVCHRFLPDRYVLGRCPGCGAIARGDQCDACTRLLSPEDLLDPVCSVCGTPARQEATKHFYLKLAQLAPALERDAAANLAGFRTNARQETRRFLREGLADRAVTRDLDWGVPVPLDGWEGKSVYVWIDAVLGYLSASQIWSEQEGRDWRTFWQPDASAWYVHGKDNIVFHTLILPALLLGAAPELKRPDHIVSSEYLTLEGEKISTSRGHVIGAAELLDCCPADAVRYGLLANNPEKRDADFSLHAFVASHNGELLGAFGNLVQRTFAFVWQYRDAVTPNEACDHALRRQIEDAYRDCGAFLDRAEIRKSLERAFLLVRQLNQYFDREKPWQTRHDDPTACDRTLATCLHGICNLAQLLAPFLPFASASVRAALQLDGPPGWSYVACPCGRILAKPEPLYPRLTETGLQAALCCQARSPRLQSVR